MTLAMPTRSRSNRGIAGLGNCLGSLRFRLAPFGQIRIEEAEHMGMIDDADTLLFLQLGDLLLELFHFRPMHFRTEMMLGVVAVVEENPVINLPVATYAPRDRFVRISAIVTEISIQVAEAMAQVEEGQKEQHVPPINKADRVCRNNKCHQ
jgi:hypothetical protein